MEPVPKKLEMGTRENLWVVVGEMIGETSAKKIEMKWVINIKQKYEREKEFERQYHEW